MNINRNNYEEFFLMYVDNELSDAGIKDVHKFLLQNPDLKQELELLQQSILKPDEIIFTDKNLLLKEELMNDELQGKLLLFLDDELSAIECEKVDELIKNNDVVAKEWILLQQTKLQQDESILFENKLSLYKTSRERVINFNWRKVAVAAILIGFILWTGVSFFVKKDTAHSSVAGLKNNINDTSIANNQAIKQVNNQPLKKDTSNILSQYILAQQIIKTTALKIKKQSRQQKNIVVFYKDDDKKPINNNLSQQNFNNDSSNNTETANVSLKKLISEVSNHQNDRASDNNKLIDNNKNAYATTASFNDNADNNSDDNHIFYIPEKKLQKTKIGGFFTKIKNAGKKGIHIANIEIAIK